MKVYVGAVLFLISSWLVHAQVEWTLANPNLTGAAYGNGAYVVVEETGWIRTSQDLSNWNRQISPVSAQLSDVAFGNGAFVVIGGSLGNAVFLRSTNGLEWTRQTLDQEQISSQAPLVGVKFLNDQFVAFGGYVEPNASFGWILTSPDGVTWEVPFSRPLIAPPIMEPGIFGISFGAGTYLAVGGSQQFGPSYNAFARVLQSLDGKIWTEMENVAGAISSDIAFGNGTFVAVGAGGILTFTDGVWTPGPAVTGLRSIVHGHDGFVAVGDGGNIRTSVDGLSWTNQTSGTTARLKRVVLDQNGFVAVGDSGTVLHSVDGQQWKLVLSSFISGGFGGIAYGNGHFVASHFNEMLRSDDGRAWGGSQVAGNGVNLAKVAYGAGKFVVVANNTPNAVLFTSPDGVAWHEPILPTTVPLTTVAFLNNRFLATGAGAILSSCDGETWNVVDSTSHTWLEIAYGDGLFLALSDQEAANATFAATSRDGVVWETQPTAMNISGYPFAPRGSLTFGKGMFVAAVGTIYTSTNGVDWQPVYGPNYSAVMHVNGVFVASGVASIATSLDGLNWTPRPADFLLVHWWHGPVFLGFGNNTFVRVCGGEGAELQTSPATFLFEARRQGPLGGLEMNVFAGSQPTFQVQASRDMRSWSTILTLPNSAASTPVADPEASKFPERFYRLATPTP